jgi:transposase
MATDGLIGINSIDSEVCGESIDLVAQCGGGFHGLALELHFIPPARASFYGVANAANPCRRSQNPSDLSDREWDLIKHLVPEVNPGGRLRQYPKRAILNGIFYIVRRDYAWRLMPHDWPPWQLIYQYFWRWRRDSTWQRMHDLLCGDVRAAAGKRRQPSAGIIDS